MTVGGITTIADALRAARARIGPMEARLLLRHVLVCPPVWLETHDDEVLSEEAAARFVDWVARREAGEPVAYLLGYREFYGRDFTVSPAVLIPRPETELLVELALARLKNKEGARILDLGTGSGCIAVTLALECPSARVSAVDASANAIRVAQSNAVNLGARVSFHQGNWFEPLANQCFDLIVSNPPYIVEGDVHLRQGDLRFEPSSALASGADGLADIRRIVGGVPRYLVSGGWLMLEHGYDQAEAVAEIFAHGGFVAIEQHRDLAGIIRVTGGCLIDRREPVGLK